MNDPIDMLGQRQCREDKGAPIWKHRPWLESEESERIERGIAAVEELRAWADTPSYSLAVKADDLRAALDMVDRRESSDLAWIKTLQNPRAREVAAETIRRSLSTLFGLLERAKVEAVLPGSDLEYQFSREADSLFVLFMELDAALKLAQKEARDD